MYDHLGSGPVSFEELGVDELSSDDLDFDHRDLKC